MAQAKAIHPSSPPPPIPDRLPSLSPRPSSSSVRSTSNRSGSGARSRSSLSVSPSRGLSSSKNESKENQYPHSASKMNGTSPSLSKVEDDSEMRIRKNPPRSARPSSLVDNINHLNTLPTISDPPTEDSAIEDDLNIQNDQHSQPQSHTHANVPPPPAPSTQTGTGDRPIAVTRKRRSSSVKRKPSPGVTPTKAVDWEIPRKTLHSSIGFLTLLLNHLNPPTLTPLITVLTTSLFTISTVDFFRLKFPAFAEIWESYLGFLMRESERNKINGVVWYLIGVITVLSLYPRDVAVVAILTLSWSDTTASTIGRLWGKYTKPLPTHFPGIKALKFAPRKSLAGFLAASVTGFLIGITFWWSGSNGRWIVLDVEDWGHGYWGLWVTAAVVGIGGAVVEALDLGVDDNLTLPILSGAVVWAWLAATNFLLK
ncbi:hypothetical protein I302_103126 [Kwoniella bestiolae CBS 10118]|uniref:Phosphatidate cytidylyltransferase n=1 Tax=Kwoniella bestiolae CBS 10118 TaxID=1296100 RepID=A0AAJ8M803_9TREE